MAVQLFIMFIFGLLCALIAAGKGRNPIGWFFIGFFITLIGLIIALVVSNLKEEQERHERLERENRRLRERVRKDRMIADQRHRQIDRRIRAHDRIAGIDTSEPERAPMSLDFDDRDEDDDDW